MNQSDEFKAIYIQFFLEMENYIRTYVEREEMKMSKDGERWRKMEKG